MERKWSLFFGLIGSVALAACGGAVAPDDGGAHGDGDAQLAGRCGDGEVGAGEQCDDGNDVAFDGCEPITCTFTCESDATCDDGEPCNGVESCNLETHACEAGDAPDDGDACTKPGIDDGVCRAGGCVDAGCGNGVVDGAEDCDDGNTVSGDGCENDCRFSCTRDEDCITPDVCDGTESCDLETHACVTTGPPDCDDGSPCTEDSCDPVEGCVHTLIDNDGDGHASTDLGECGDDCDDDDPSTYAGAPELCEVGTPVDNDCDPSTPNPTANLWFLDCDGDSYAAGPHVSMTSCAAPAPQGTCGWTTRIPVTGDPSTIDCNDARADMHPGQTMYFTSPHPCPGCSGNDRFASYDCNGTVNKQYASTPFNVSPTASCTPVLDSRATGGVACSGTGGWTAATEPACGFTGNYTSCVREPDECFPRSSLDDCRGYTPVCVGDTRFGGPCYCPPRTVCTPDCLPGTRGCLWRMLRCDRATSARTLGCR